MWKRGDSAHRVQPMGRKDSASAPEPLRCPRDRQCRILARPSPSPSNCAPIPNRRDSPVLAFKARIHRPGRHARSRGPYAFDTSTGFVDASARACRHVVLRRRKRSDVLCKDAPQCPAGRPGLAPATGHKRIRRHLNRALGIGLGRCAAGFHPETRISHHPGRRRWRSPCARQRARTDRCGRPLQPVSAPGRRRCCTGRGENCRRSGFARGAGCSRTGRDRCYRRSRVARA